MKMVNVKMIGLLVVMAVVNVGNVFADQLVEVLHELGAKKQEGLVGDFQNADGSLTNKNPRNDSLAKKYLPELKAMLAEENPKEIRQLLKLLPHAIDAQGGTETRFGSALAYVEEKLQEKIKGMKEKRVSESRLEKWLLEIDGTEKGKLAVHIDNASCGLTHDPREVAIVTQAGEWSKTTASQANQWANELKERVNQVVPAEIKHVFPLIAKMLHKYQDNELFTRTLKKMRSDLISRLGTEEKRVQDEKFEHGVKKPVEVQTPAKKGWVDWALRR